MDRAVEHLDGEGDLTSASSTIAGAEPGPDQDVRLANVNVLAMLLATPAAYALSRGRFRFRGPAAEGILVFRMLPLVVLLPPLYLMLLAVGLLDSLPGLSSGSPHSACHSRSG